MEENKNDSGSQDQDPALPDSGWLTVKEYGEKYGITRDQVKNLTRSNRVVYKVIEEEFPPKKYILDVPVAEQPVKRTTRKYTRSGNYSESYAKGKIRPVDVGSKLEVRRKKHLKELHLPTFIENAPPDRMVFTGEELVRIFNITDATLYRDWRKWGLVKRDIPENYRELSDQTMTGRNYYYRRDIVRFLNGEWSPPKEGTPDDVLIGAAEDRVALEGEYYRFDPVKVYPPDGNGVLAWIEDKEIMREDRRENRWVRFAPWEAQREFIKEAFSLKENGDYKYNLIVFSAPRGDGKSMCKGTKVIMYDGSFKNVEDVMIGDLLMGPDSTPRKVLSLGHGMEEMYEVSPIKGDPFTCNESHILSLQIRHPRESFPRQNGKRVRWSEYEYENIKLTDYLQKDQCYKDRAYLYRVPIDWPEKPVNVDPWFLGNWLAAGNGHVNITINREDTEIVEGLRIFARERGIELVEKPDPKSKGMCIRFRGAEGDKLREAMRGYGLFGNKHIPHDYKANSREVRLQILAGLLDGDGYVNRTGYVITQKVKQLAEDIAFVARSLGFFAQVREVKGRIKSRNFEGTYYKVCISGDCSIIPLRLPRKRVPKRRINKDVLRTRIKDIHAKGKGEYYGFMLDGDGLYLLHDFTVTHNTFLVAVLTLFRFFNRYGEIVNLSGNSKDQATFAHYELCKKIIQNTPRLKSTPGLSIKEKSISLLGGPKESICQIKAIPTSTGLLPGTTCAVFTELHNLEERKFFIDLWTSTRGTPNAMVLVDTTVAAPGHIVHELWESYQNGEDPLLYFHHYADKHYNPEVTPEQLNSFRRHTLEHEYNMYFRNRWEDATGGLFTLQKIKEMGYCGVDGVTGPSVNLETAVQNLTRLENKRLTFEKGGTVDLAEINREIQEVQSRLMPIDKIYKLPVTPDDLERISSVFGINFIIGIGIDRAQQLGKGSDRTAVVCVARGVVSAEVSYYFILDIFMPSESVLPVITNQISDWTMLYGWVDKVAIESYLGADIHAWCQDRGYDSEIVSPTFSAQKAIFTEVYQLMEQGHLKVPRVPYYTDDDGVLYRGFTTKDDILREEMKMFTYKARSAHGWFGSPEKKNKGGTKDDVIYALAWAIYATQGENAIAMGRKSMKVVGGSVVNRDVVGDYRD